MRGVLVLKAAAANGLGAASGAHERDFPGSILHERPIVQLEEALNVAAGLLKSRTNRQVSG
jgi:hypothetical protein